MKEQICLIQICFTQTCLALDSLEINQPEVNEEKPTEGAAQNTCCCQGSNETIHRLTQTLNYVPTSLGEKEKEK